MAGQNWRKRPRANLRPGLGTGGSVYPGRSWIWPYLQGLVQGKFLKILKKMKNFTQEWNCVISCCLWRPAKFQGNVPEQVWGLIWAQGGPCAKIGARFDHISKGWPRGNFWKSWKRWKISHKSEIVWFLAVFEGRPNFRETSQTKSEAWFGHWVDCLPRLVPDLTISPRVGPWGTFKKQKIANRIEIFHPEVKLCDFSTFLKSDQNWQKGPRANLRPDLGRGGLVSHIGGGFGHIFRGWPMGHFQKTQVQPTLEIFHSKFFFSICPKMTRKPKNEEKNFTPTFFHQKWISWF